MSGRREQRRRERHEKWVAKHLAKEVAEEYKRHNAPKRIRGARCCGLYSMHICVILYVWNAGW